MASVIPNPAAAFSPLTITKSKLCSQRSGRAVDQIPMVRPVRPTMSPRNNNAHFKILIILRAKTHTRPDLCQHCVQRSHHAHPRVWTATRWQSNATPTNFGWYPFTRTMQSCNGAVVVPGPIANAGCRHCQTLPAASVKHPGQAICSLIASGSGGAKAGIATNVCCLGQVFA